MSPVPLFGAIPDFSLSLFKDSKLAVGQSSETNWLAIRGISYESLQTTRGQFSFYFGRLDVGGSAWTLGWGQTGSCLLFCPVGQRG